MNRDIRIQLGVRRTGQHLDLVAEIHEGSAQLLEVDALTAAMRIAAVREKANAKRSIHMQTYQILTILSWKR